MSRRAASASVRLDSLFSTTRIMPATKECPLCGANMRIREQQTTVKVPGNPSAIPRRTREWVCPDCDYFEEAEEENSR